MEEGEAEKATQKKKKLKRKKNWLIPKQNNQNKKCKQTTYVSTPYYESYNNIHIRTKYTMQHKECRATFIFRHFTFFRHSIDAI